LIRLPNLPKMVVQHHDELRLVWLVHASLIGCVSPWSTCLCWCLVGWVRKKIKLSFIYSKYDLFVLIKMLGI
jgi:hypothetical protein